MADKLESPTAIDFEDDEAAIAYARTIATRLSFSPASSGEPLLCVRNEDDETIAIISIPRPPH